MVLERPVTSCLLIALLKFTYCHASQASQTGPGQTTSASAARLGPFGAAQATSAAQATCRSGALVVPVPSLVSPSSIGARPSAFGALARPIAPGAGGQVVNMALPGLAIPPTMPCVAAPAVAVPSLAAGWSEAFDEEGSLYFWNFETGETAWDRPGCRATPASSCRL